MNLFKELWSKAKDALKEANRELSLKAQYKSYIAKKEELLVENKNKLNDRILNDNCNFESICSIYEDIQVIEEEIEIAKEAYEYIFTEKDKK